jgi:hypothetical protein
MTTFRNPSKDRLKSTSMLKEQVRLQAKCKHKDCTNDLTIFDGPGSDLLCRLHQLELVEYGGYGKLSKLHTFHRRDVCECCGQDINDDPRWEKAQKFFETILTEAQKSEVKRRYNHGDHNGLRKADGGDDSAENIAALCSFCHWVKTVIFNDGRRSDLKE